MTMSSAFLNRGRVATVATAPPPGSDPRSASPAPRAITATVAYGNSGIEGRLSLMMLAALIGASVLFYYWTRTAQGGG